MRLTDLADDLRASGLTVVEAAGWQDRGVDLPGMPDTIVCHHTATPDRSPGDMPTLALIVKGRHDLPGPLSQLGLSRSGVVYVIAAGKANHAGKGSWRGRTASSRTIGIEAEHPGGDAPWTAVQYAAYVALCAALCRYLGVSEERVCAHREWALPAGRKVDVTFDMAEFRSKVGRRLTPALTPAPKGPPPMVIVKDPAGPHQYLVHLGRRWRIASLTELRAYEKVCPRVDLEAAAFARLVDA